LVVRRDSYIDIERDFGVGLEGPPGHGDIITRGLPSTLAEIGRMILLAWELGAILTMERSGKMGLSQRSGLLAGLLGSGPLIFHGLRYFTASKESGLLYSSEILPSKVRTPRFRRPS
jgi:hypothetical protein